MSRLKVTITGPAGSGKTLLTRALIGLLRKHNKHWSATDAGGANLADQDDLDACIAAIPPTTKVVIENYTPQLGTEVPR